MFTLPRCGLNGFQGCWGWPLVSARLVPAHFTVPGMEKPCRWGLGRVSKVTLRVLALDIEWTKDAARVDHVVVAFTGHLKVVGITRRRCWLRR